MPLRPLTIFTPTYNRRDCLRNCYRSLLQQDSNEFRWQIVDDGSTDGTDSLVQQWIYESILDIEYIKIDNGGKARATNISLARTNTWLWMCLDSDDTLTSNAVSIILEECIKIKYNNDICGLFSLRGEYHGSSCVPMQGISIPMHIKQTTQSYVRYILKIPPEYSHVYKTAIIKKYPYPEIKGETYFPLSYIFDQIDLAYNYKIIHHPFMLCEYRSDGLTRNKRSIVKKNPVGYLMYKKQLISLAPKKYIKFRAAITYVTACFLASRNPLKGNKHKFVTIIAVPFAIMDFTIRYKGH